ncbi:MAG: winged helix-turn-helix domain-containing protein [Deltaproteobacteria bacterium]
MSVVETWQAPDWFASSAAAHAGLRIVIVDGAAADERCLLHAARAAGIDCAWGHWSDGDRGRAALLFELQSGLSVALHCLRALRADPHLAALPAIVSISPEQLAQLPSLTAFDDFVLQPCTLLEVRTRIHIIERRRASSAPVPQAPLDAELDDSPEEDGIRVDAVSHEALVDGETIRLTAREFALFAYLRERRGRVLSRQHLLERVWGHRYHGGPRTVDTHIGRLRLKFGAALPIETVRSNGYRLGQGAQDLPAQDLALQHLAVQQSAAE